MTHPSTQPMPCTVCGEDLASEVSVAFRREAIVVRHSDDCYSDATSRPWNPGIHLHVHCVGAYFDGLLTDVQAGYDAAVATDDDEPEP